MGEAHIVVTYVREGEFPEAYVRRRAQGFAREDIPGSNPVTGYGTTTDVGKESALQIAASGN
jgi:hypothetical protein